MAAITVTLHFQSLSSHIRTLSYSSFINSHAPTTPVLLRRRCASDPLRLENSRNWIRQVGASPRGGMVMGDYDYDEDDDDSEEEEEDRSLDLLIRFVQNVFRKVSRKARNAVKSVLPVPISTRLIVHIVILIEFPENEFNFLGESCLVFNEVGFAVNGTIILTFLWVLKAFLEVICTLGSVVFASILLIRGVWTGISYFQETRCYRADEDEPPQSWTRTQPAS